MLLEDADYCCDYCGATYGKFSDKWTLPTYPNCEVICDKCKCQVPIQESNYKQIFDSIEFYSETLCNKCLTNSLIFETI
jgi:hypothetical protein